MPKLNSKGKPHDVNLSESGREAQVIHIVFAGHPVSESNFKRPMFSIFPSGRYDERKSNWGGTKMALTF